MTEFPLAPGYYLDAVRVESERFASAACHSSLETEVATCPGWDVAKLVLHVGILHRWVTAMVANGSTERLDHRTIERAPDGADRISWFEHGSLELAQTLNEAGTDRLVWTLSGLGRSGFWFRRMAQETMVHRFDLELAVGSLSAIDPLLAADGIDEFWTVQLERKLPLQPIDGLVGVLTLRASDIEAEWTIGLNRGSMTILERGFPADVTVIGSADELLLFLWNRGPITNCTIEGNRQLVDTWHDHVHL